MRYVYISYVTPETYITYIIYTTHVERFFSAAVVFTPYARRFWEQGIHRSLLTRRVLRYCLLSGGKVLVWNIDIFQRKRVKAALVFSVFFRRSSLFPARQTFLGAGDP